MRRKIIEVTPDMLKRRYRHTEPAQPTERLTYQLGEVAAATTDDVFRNRRPRSLRRSCRLVLEADSTDAN
jgi:hypothetical protein